MFYAIQETNLRFKLYCRIRGTDFSVIAANENIVEISFLRTWTASMKGSSVPMNIDKRWIPNLNFFLQFESKYRISSSTLCDIIFFHAGIYCEEVIMGFIHTQYLIDLQDYLRWRFIKLGLFSNSTKPGKWKNVTMRKVNEKKYFPLIFEKLLVLFIDCGWKISNF